MGRLRAAALLGALLGLGGCTTPWDPPGLRPHAATLAAIPGHRLFDATPYLLPVRGRLIAFYCRWPSDAPIPVFLPADATPDERRALDAALAAWASAGLGLRFERRTGSAEEPERGISIAFLDAASTPRAEGTGYTLADCRLDAADPAALAAARLPARLERARIRIVRRDTGEWDADDHAWFAGEVAGVALHELAHALGFQGHARFGGGLLAADTKESTKVGRRVLAGATFGDATLRALYALPSGLVLERVAVPAARTAALDARLAAPPPGAGPFVRVGDRSGRIFWRDGEGRERGVTLASVATARAHPERLVLLPDAAPR